MADDKHEFKKYQDQMALKRQRKTEKNTANKNKNRLLPSRLTIQRLSSQVKGSSQKYARMGPLKRVEVPEEDLSSSPSIDIVRRACINGFKMEGFVCDLLESEREPSMESLDEVKNLNATIFVRFILKPTAAFSSEFLNESDENENSNGEEQRSPPLKKVYQNPQKVKVEHHSISSGSSNTANCSSSFPASMSVISMLKLGSVVKSPEREDLLLEVEQLQATNGWSMARNITFSVEVESFAEGGFRKAYRCESEDKNFPGIWVLKKYNEKTLDGLKKLAVEEEVHARKQVQMHTLAQNITNQMKKYVDKEFGEAFSYDNMYLGKVQSTYNANQGFVTIEKYIEGNFIKYVNNTGDVTANKNDVITQKAESLVHFSYQMSKGAFLLVDIQGTGYKLYDPEIASTILENNDGENHINFCLGNLSRNAIDGFFEKHTCNFYCKRLGLKEDEPKYHV